MENLVKQIKACIEKKLDSGFREFIIFPFGETRLLVKQILNEAYGIQERYILDNHLCVYNPKINSAEVLDSINCKNYCLILSSVDEKICLDLKEMIKKYFEDENIAEIIEKPNISNKITKIGKYSYGPLCKNHLYIESIGAFCSFAAGTEVVQNHEMNYLTTHPMIYAGANLNIFKKYAEYREYDWYFDGVEPKKEKIEKRGRCKIGNDVWLGRNVIITNYSNIGNGVIAGAGSVITKDVPDYAVVAGVPARIVRYRYTPSEIESLNKIAWWDWSDENIMQRYDDFYLPIQDFINKYS